MNYRSSIFLLVFMIFVGCTRSGELQWHQEDGYRWAEVKPSFWGSDGFRQLSSSRTGIDFITKLTDEEIAENRHYLNGAGVAAGDINGNGLVDLYFTGLGNSNRLYKNLGGFRFEDITEQAGVEHHDYISTGAVFADVNGNGHLDLLVTALYGENVLYINDGTGTFEREPNSGLGLAKGGMTMALADITGNGYPDLYITNYKEKSVKDIYTTQELDWNNILYEPLRSPTDEYTLVPPFDHHYELVRQDGALIGISEVGEIDELYLNNGGVFEKVADPGQVFLNEFGEPMGLQRDWGLTARFQDINGNGLPDLYVCNDFHTPDRVWINQGDGTFKNASWKSFRNFSYSCMAVDFSDINRNGRLDIFTTEMLDPDHERRLRQAASDQHEEMLPGAIEQQPMYNRNSLFLQREDMTFAEATYFAGVEATGWSWATRFMDVNLNGYEDIIVTTGYKYDILDIDAQFEMMRNRRNMDEHFMEFVELVDPLDQQNKILRNNGNLTFTDVSGDWGFTDLDVSHGMAFADLNNNGTLDIILNRMNKEAVIFENRTKAQRISVRLTGKEPNTQAIGARVELLGAGVHQQKEVTSGGDYLSGSANHLMFAADPDNPDHEIRIFWPNGNTSSIRNVQANRIYEIDESEIGFTDLEQESETNFASPLFERLDDVDVLHHDELYQDFNLQAFLPWKLSQMGPGVGWLDVRGNGNEELIMSSGKGGALTVLDLSGDGISEVDLTAIRNLAPGDQTAIAGWQEDGKTRLVLGSANYEQGRSGAASAYMYTIHRDGSVETDSIPGILSTTGPIAAADVTGNGYPDLFIGGSFKPGQYPADADSRLFLNENGSFQLDARHSQMFEGLGLVTGALFSDITGNGRPDLLVSVEWGNLRLFENQNGNLTEVTEAWGLHNWQGLWKGVATGDFTNNGRMDIVAANIGRNTSYQIIHGKPIRIYYSDLDGFGATDIIEAYANENGDYVPKRRLFEFQEQQVRLNRMGSHRQFAESTLREILGERYDRTDYKELNTIEHMVFINHGTHFEAKPLPDEAQLSPAFHVGVADFNNNGNEDIFLSQNFFALPEHQPRMDAGRGLVLLGDGNGDFGPISGTESGIKIYGEQRGAAFADFNQNGKTDIAVSQNANRLMIYQNQAESSGIRVTLNGPPSNQNGIGSSVSLIYQNGEKGPRRDIQAGSGYWSLNSLVQVLGYGQQVPVQIEVHWFDGENQTLSVEEGEMEFVIEHPANSN